MVAAGMLIIWGGYSISLWGWCLLRGYDITFGALVSPVHPYGSRKGQPWPPPVLDPSQVFPSGRRAGAAAAQVA